ncbi:Gfo/Idh/MocA family oxidoreductase [Amycolatopsis rubida]|uniref:Gfo/Idh/MocA family oxidoreductase n=1 Tax=Amycolatopsis rubida TaxID=112413 RepID=A0ABX0BX35_9PSEU|nr:bi-domain-containing oxidoreductase [Amycolatopsis sp. M39]MYW94026.1 Gfo/Idh/MocA family oxidoreductase [Amycolatopsis rubida]NEC59015.1 Gfo/Idh/MocA family oxidoreductase [Amycolatopsis rubida]OAP22100.1 Glucose--fructose oxidoreductase precursor [Amycolatopsis sp. M39]
MKQVVQNYKSGELALLDVPVPACKPGGVLVRSQYSLISTGTEMMKVSEAGMSLLGKARSRPDQVAKVMQSVATNGLAATYRKVSGKLDSYTPLGYSLCGVVEQVGEGIDDVVVGDLVACAGNEHALHSELNWVPKNLYAKVPAGLSPRQAAFATVGAIAMQGVRRGEPQLGDLTLVIGLGLIGQLVVQLLVANGARVVGVDPDAQRCELARELGALACGHPASGEIDQAVAELSGGHGVDQVYLAAGGASNDPVELAARLARDRGRVVDIGKISLNLPWNAYYEKELDVRFSRSYGPGRYDPAYELAGRDYPIGYVRWTERRNLECFLDLAARGRLDVTPLISHTADFARAVETYRALNEGELKAVAVLFRYPDAPPAEDESVVSAVPAAAAVETRPNPLRDLRIGFIGAGNYASSMILPHLAGDERVLLTDVVTTSALSGANAKRKFGFVSASTDVAALLEDDQLSTVFVVTRHSSHAELTRRALLAGKAVFVEKPLALSEKELRGVVDAVAESGNNRLQVGFNRRFAPLLVEAKNQFGPRVGPASVRYLVNAGRLDANSWYNQADSEGSRFVGEGGHFIDTVSWFLGSDPVSVYATGTPGNHDLQVLLRYADGSTAAISYLTSGSTSFPKETLEVLADGKVLKFDDFVRASVYGPKRWTSSRLPKARDKGQRAELDAFITALKTGVAMPISLDSLVSTTLATLAVHRSLETGAPVRLER